MGLWRRLQFQNHRLTTMDGSSFYDLIFIRVCLMEISKFLMPTLLAFFINMEMVLNSELPQPNGTLKIRVSWVSLKTPEMGKGRK